MCSSRFMGVSWNKDIRKWQAYIQVDGVQHHLGLFENEEEAARARDAAAVELFGSFARLNLSDQKQALDCVI